MDYHYIKNKICNISEAVISVFDLSVMRGYGVFDFFKVLDGIPIFVDDHIQRFINSSEALHLHCHLSKSQLKEVVYELIEKNKIHQGSIKMILTGGESTNGFNLDAAPTLLILPSALTFKVYNAYTGIKTLKLKTLDYVRETPGIKSINYLVAMMNWHLLSDGGFDDFLYVKSGWISETSRANIFLINDKDELITPKENILEGITRKYILQAGLKYCKVIERNISLEELIQAKEVFLTSTTKQAMPVVQIDSASIGNGLPGEITGKIFNDFHQQEMKYIEEHKKTS